MSREGIYIGKQEVVARYVGDKLVWEKKRQTKIVDINRISYIYTSGIDYTAKIYGDYTYLQQATFTNVKLIVNDVAFPFLLPEVTLDNARPIATIKFKSRVMYDAFNSRYNAYGRYRMQMYIEE